MATASDFREYLSSCIATDWAGILPNHLILLPPGNDDKCQLYLIEEFLLDGR